MRLLRRNHDRYVYVVLAPGYDGEPPDEPRVLYVAENLNTAFSLIRQPFDADSRYKVQWGTPLYCTFIGWAERGEDGWELQAEFADVPGMVVAHSVIWAIERWKIQHAGESKPR